VTKLSAAGFLSDGAHASNLEQARGPEVLVASNIREDFASLKIDRSDPSRTSGKGGSVAAVRERGGCLGCLSSLFSFVGILVVLAVLGSAAVVAYRQYDEIRSKPEVIVDLVQTMTTGEAEKLLSAKGYIRSAQQALLGTKVAGRVQEMLVKEQDKVKKGQVLAVIEHGDLDAMIEQRKASLEKTKAELEEARADLRQKDREASLAQERTTKKLAAAEDSERAGSAREMATARVAALEASVKLMQAGVKEVEYTLEYEMKIRAPFDGTVVAQQSEVGEVTGPMVLSLSSRHAGVVTVADLKNLDVETDIAEDMISRIALNQPAEVSVLVVPNKRYKGRLRQIIPMGDRTRGTVKVNVKIEDPDDKLFPELAAQVHFLPFKSGTPADGKRAYLFVNKSAVFQENGHDFVWVVDRKHSRVNKRQVEVATTRAELARVESGLRADEGVVLNAPASLKDGDVVRIPDQ
jgi:RND family efflux transporter MFP subunit